MSFENFLSSAFLVLAASQSPPAADNPAFMQIAQNEEQDALSLPLDTPTDVNGIETVCTGIDSDSRDDPRWAAYPLRLEFAAGNRAYVANEAVSIMGGGGALALRCAGPWVLAKLPPGQYRVVASVSGVTKNATVTVPRKGQARFVLHFPEVPANESDGSMEPYTPMPEPTYEPVEPGGTPQ